MFFIVISLSGCLSHWAGYEEDSNDEGIDDKNVIFTMKFLEGSDWDKPGNEDWSRWYYEYQNTNELYDLSTMLKNNKVYIFTYSFRSDIDVNSLGVNFCNTKPNWKMITDWTYIIGNIKKYNIYSGKIIIIPNKDAAGCDPKNTYFHFDIGNRNVNTPATLSFYEFKLEQVNKEVSKIDKWTISTGEIFTIDTSRTFAEILPVFEGENNVLHIKPTYNMDNYGDFVIQYNLSDWAGKQIEIEMFMEAYLEKPARIAWQINSSDPYYPVICGTVAPNDRFPDDSGPALEADGEWHKIQGSNTVIIPTTNGTAGKLLYLSGQQIEGAPAYFANAKIGIKDVTPTFNFTGVTQNGSASQTTTKLTLKFSGEEIPDLSADNISLSGVSGITKGTLNPIDSDSGAAYTLDISDFTSGGTLNVTLKKDGYNIIDSSRTVPIYYHTTVDFNSVTANGSTSEPKTTTQLTLNFSQAITGLNANDIILSDDSITKGTLSGSGSTYTLPISGVTSSKTLTVTVTKPNYTINDSPKTVDIIYSAFDSAVGLKGLTIASGDVITVDTNTGIISKKLNSGWGNYFSVAIPANQLPINTGDRIVVKYIGFGDASLIVKLPNSYDDVNPEMYPTFIGNQAEQTFQIDASRYEAKMPNTPNAVLTFQGMQNNPVAWKLKIIDITVEHN